MFPSKNAVFYNECCSLVRHAQITKVGVEYFPVDKTHAVLKQHSLIAGGNLYAVALILERSPATLLLVFRHVFLR